MSTSPVSNVIAPLAAAHAFSCWPGLDALQKCSSISSLRAALTALCSDHGELLRLDIVPTAQAGRQQAMCFMRLRTTAQELSLMRSLGIGRFGGELVLVVSLESWLHSSRGSAAHSELRH
jgi:hypothetical protein